ncbi:hypothetical protein DL89DRAFT_269256 [Linderina pennispora]|uniref:Uncharacterized protein n=1 Tax=Linderina pennispora TaxID=61395 RepID=A0A1Y1W1W7_9FUNG|nr:uncharacterized protein DL89DRAFT_269256 [Linderina pennispora]ORX67442.1 hypothetical protein DL89DRAFT_269256 [Linderina pennispora]
MDNAKSTWVAIIGAVLLFTLAYFTGRSFVKHRRQRDMVTSRNIRRNRHDPRPTDIEAGQISRAHTVDYELPTYEAPPPVYSPK